MFTSRSLFIPERWQHFVQKKRSFNIVHFLLIRNVFVYQEAEEELSAKSVFGGAKASQEADNILILQERRTDTGRRKFLQVCSTNKMSSFLLIVIQVYRHIPFETSFDESNILPNQQVVKNRYSGDLGAMPLEFHKESLSFAPPKKANLVRRNPSSVAEGH